MSRHRWMEALARVGRSDFSESDVEILSRSYHAICSYLGLDRKTNFTGGIVELSRSRRGRHSIFEETWVAWKFSFFLQALRCLPRKDYVIWRAYYVLHLTEAEIYWAFARRKRSLSKGESTISMRLKRIRMRLADMLRGDESEILQFC